MNFESLANELLLHIFEFLPTHHLIDAFHGLNFRFNSLIFHHFAVSGIDSRSFHANNFVTICQKYAPSLIDKLPPMYLLEKDSSQLLNQFDTHDFTLGQFIQFKSLPFSDPSEDQLRGKIILGLPHLINLTSLTEYDLEHLSTDHSFINYLWSLPNITHCSFDAATWHQLGYGDFEVPTTTSSSITNLSIFHLNIDFFNLEQICASTPNLQHLSISFSGNCIFNVLTSTVLSITSIELLLTNEEFDLLSMLQCMPYLCRLKVECCYYVSGYEWESIIFNYLPKIKRFHIKMSSKFEEDEMFDKQVDEMIDTFRTPFWLNEHGWFVQCQWHPTISNFELYTLPYTFSDITLKYPFLYKSTCPHNNRQQRYDTVRYLRYNNETENCSEKSDIRFHKLEKLEIQLPVGEHFWSMVPTLYHLTSCEITSYDNSEECQNQFQFLLSRARSLLFLSFRNIKKDDSNESIAVEINNRLKKQLDLQEIGGSFDEKLCIRFSHLPLATQYEELHIRVKSRISICYLVKTILCLRILFVKCDDDEWQRRSLPEDGNKQVKSTEDELVSWLQQHLSGLRSVIRIFRWRYTIVLKFS